MHKRRIQTEITVQSIQLSTSSETVKTIQVLNLPLLFFLNSSGEHGQEGAGDGHDGGDVFDFCDENKVSYFVDWISSSMCDECQGQVSHVCWSNWAGKQAGTLFS